MTITTTWDVLNLKRTTNDGYVYSVQFELKSTDGTYEDKLGADLALEKPDTLIPYKDLTKTIVLKWVQDKLTAMNAADAARNPSCKQLEDLTVDKVKEQQTPTKADGVPW